jgi:hypothetical protein
MATRLHEIVTASAPAFALKTWYGMPAYAKDGKVVCFFTAASKFNSRYATFGFNDVARLDDGAMWPTSFALTELTADTEARIAALVRQAVSDARAWHAVCSLRAGLAWVRAPWEGGMTMAHGGMRA